MKSTEVSLGQLWVMLALSLVVLIAMTAALISETELWFVGVQKQAKIVSLDHTSWSNRSGKTYHYDMGVDGRMLRLSVSSPMTIGSVFPVLVHPFDPKKFALGDVNGSLLDYLRNNHGRIGIWLMAAAFVLVFAFFVLLVFQLRNTDEFT